MLDQQQLEEWVKKLVVTKYRRKVITKKMLERLNDIFSQTLQMWDCKLIEFKLWRNVRVASFIRRDVKKKCASIGR